MHEPDNYIRDEGAAVLTPALQQLARLENLNISCKYVIGSWPWSTASDDPQAQHHDTRSLVSSGVDMHTSEHKSDVLG